VNTTDHNSLSGVGREDDGRHHSKSSRLVADYVQSVHKIS